MRAFNEAEVVAIDLDRSRSGFHTMWSHALLNVHEFPIKDLDAMLDWLELGSRTKQQFGNEEQYLFE